MFGYCVAPLNVAALVSTFVHLIYVRVPIALAAWAWCVWGKYVGVINPNSSVNTGLQPLSTSSMAQKSSSKELF